MLAGRSGQNSGTGARWTAVGAFSRHGPGFAIAEPHLMACGAFLALVTTGRPAGAGAGVRLSPNPR